MQPQTVIFMGRSGCGKGTQAKLMMDYLKAKDAARDIFYLETGARFREFIDADSHSSHLAKVIMEKGTLQPAFLAIHIWSHEFLTHLKGGEHMVLDGTPRGVSEIEALDTAFHFYERKNPTVFVLDVSREEVKTRLTERGRMDDSRVGDIEKRLTWFDTDVVPAIRHMQDAKLYNVITINGEQTVDKVHEDVIAAFEQTYGKN